MHAFPFFMRILWALLMLHILLWFLQTVKVKISDYLCNFSKIDFTWYSLACTKIQQYQIVGFDAAYDKSENRTQKIVANRSKPKFYYSNANPSYQKVSYSEQHFFFRDKSHTFTVESINSDIRKYIAAFNTTPNAFSFIGDLSSRNTCFYVSLQ